MNEQQIKTRVWRTEPLSTGGYALTEDGNIIARFHHYDERGISAKGNSTLAAAAPDLYAALIQLMAHVEEEWGVEEEGFEGCSMARAAIAKAVGQ